MDDRKVYKRSQRPTWSCSECSRRKIKCDKNIPCQQCKSRGRQHLCSLDHEASSSSIFDGGPFASMTSGPVSPDGSAPYNMTILQLQNTVRNLERRLAAVEDITGSSSSMSLSARKEYSPGSTSKITLDSPSAPIIKSEGVADAALTFEYLALGKDRNKGIILPSTTNSPLANTSNILSVPRKEPLKKSIQAALLPRKILDYVLVFAKDVISWQHGCIHTPSFQRECEAFLSMEEKEKWYWTDPLWLALFFVVQSIAIHQMPLIDVLHLAGNNKPMTAEMFLEAAMSCLDSGSYLSEPNLYTCQALAILVVCGHNVADSNLLSSYLAIGIKTCQTLNLHSLGGESARIEQKLREAGGSIQDNSPFWKSKILNLEMGKRIWWSFVQQDYFAIPFRGTSGVNPKHHDTLFPVNCHDEQLDRGELKLNYNDTDLTLVNKLRLTAMAAQIICQFFTTLPNHSPRVEHHVTPFESQLLLLLPTTQPKSSNPSLKFGLALRRYINISISHKILVLHRAFCSRQPCIQQQLLDSQIRCVELSRQILDQVSSITKSTRPEGQVEAIWTISYQAVAAATVIALSFFQGIAQESTQVTRDEVDGAKNVLEGLASRSAIAERGVKMMSQLISEFDEANKQGHNHHHQSLIAANRRRSIAALMDEGESGNQKRAKVDGDNYPHHSNLLDENHDSFSFDWDQYPGIAGVLETMPDVSKLFDGSIGNPFGGG